jgi:hypothetical protein
MQIIIATGKTYNEVVASFKLAAAALTATLEVNDLRFNYKDDGEIILTVIYMA